VAEFLKKQRDAYRYIHDQSVRLMNAGMTPEAIAETLTLPSSLASDVAVRDYYGTVRHNAKAIYQHYLGWFDGNPARLDALPRADAARRYLALMGGADQTVAAARSAFERGELRWTAELLDHVVFAQPDHRGARELLARTYEQLGYQAESAIWRNVYLSGAQELRSGKTANGPDPAQAIELLGLAPVTRYLEAMAASLNGPAGRWLGAEDQPDLPGQRRIVCAVDRTRGAAPPARDARPAGPCQPDADAAGVRASDDRHRRPAGHAAQPRPVDLGQPCRPAAFSSPSSRSRPAVSRSFHRSPRPRSLPPRRRCSPS
jgi:hypothetical protein